MKLIVGLGNPGKEYANTRHNVGFFLLDQYLGENITWKKKFNGLYCDKVINCEKVIFLKPQTYMNLSGDCVLEFINFYKISVDDMLIVQDDLDLPFLEYKLKYNSSSGGHNGIKSIINRLGTEKIPRLKIGISNDKSLDTKDYVLGSFSKDGLKDLTDFSSKFAEIINLFINKGIDECMMRYNYKMS